MRELGFRESQDTGTQVEVVSIVCGWGWKEGMFLEAFQY